MSHRASVEFPFDLFSNLPTRLSHTAVEVVKFCATHIGQKDKIFDNTSFRRAVNSYPGEDLVLGSGGGPLDFSNPVELKTEDLAAKMADGVASSLQGSFTKEELTESLLDTLSNLQRAKENGWATFIPPKPTPEPELKAKGEEEPQSSWEIRMLFMREKNSPNAPDDFQATLGIVKVNAGIKDEAGWNELKGDGVNKFTYYINRTHLVVTKGFENPSNETTGGQSGTKY